MNLSSIMHMLVMYRYRLINAALFNLLLGPSELQHAGVWPIVHCSFNSRRLLAGGVPRDAKRLPRGVINDLYTEVSV